MGPETPVIPYDERNEDWMATLRKRKAVKTIMKERLIERVKNAHLERSGTVRPQGTEQE